MNVRVSLPVFAALLPAVAFAAELPTISRAMRLAADAATAAEANDPATFVGKMEEAVALRPDLPRLLSNLAAAQVSAERPEDAIATLQRVTAMGLTLPVEEAEEFAPLRGRKDFAELVKKFSANNRPKGRGEIEFALREVTGLIEGMAWREKTGGFYFGDVNARCIWERSKEGKLRRLTAEGDELLGVFGLIIDEGNGAIWAATSAVPAMRGFTPEQQGTAALVEVDLATGAIRRTLAVPPPLRGEAMSLLGDIALAADGTVYLPDSGEPIIWRLSPGARALDRFAESPEFMSLQGIAITRTGVAVVADQINGLLRIDLATGEAHVFEVPENTTLAGIEGLVLGRGNFVLATQSGIRPARVLRIDFDAGFESIRGVTVLESAHLNMPAPALGCIGPGGNFYFVGNGGWSRFEGSGGEPTPPRAVPVFKTALGAKP